MIDGVFVNLGFTALFALVALVENAFNGSGNGSNFAIAVGSTIWVVMGSLYLVLFWALAGQTPGMRFVGIRLSSGRLPLRRGFRRMFGLYLSVVTFGFGFLGVVFRENRRGWEDRFAGVDVLYDERRPEPAPWSQDLPAPPQALDGSAGAVGDPALQQQR